MLRKLRLEKFKSFREAELSLGPMTLLVGENATGKSNVRDALRFLHGISRGYSVAEVFGEEWGEGGVRQWKGIRGGAHEAAFAGAPTFALEIELTLPGIPAEQGSTYRIEVDVGRDGRPPRVIAERLTIAGQVVFAVPVPPGSGIVAPPSPTTIWIPDLDEQVTLSEYFDGRRPTLPELVNRVEIPASVRGHIRSTLHALGSLRFLELDPNAMRRPFFPGQTVVDDRGENLSSVLQAICEDPRRKSALLRWVQDLTPMDASDFEFPTDQIGQVLATVIEVSGQKISAYSASDGTLRLLGMIAAFLGPEPAPFYFFEEIENAIHPTRLYLLARLMDQMATKGAIQVVATTQSPGLLRELSRASLESASLTYRIRGQREAKIKPIVDIPDARRLIKEHDIARLHESGWFEDVLTLDEEDEDAVAAG